MVFLINSNYFPLCCYFEIPNITKTFLNSSRAVCDLQIETNPIASKNYDNYSMPDTLPRPKENSLSLALER